MFGPLRPLLRRSSPQKRTRGGDVVLAYRLANPNLNGGAILIDGRRVRLSYLCVSTPVR